MNRKLLGVVLCGGRSARMGRDKATLRYDRHSFLQQAIMRLKNVCDDVVISGQTQLAHELVMIPDLITDLGPVGGIAASLEHARQHQFAGCLVTPIDTPWLTADDLGKLRDQWRSSNKLTVAVSPRIEPLVAIYPVDLTDQLQQLAASADRSLYRWIDRQDHTPLPFPADRLRNINSPADYAKLVAAKDEC